MLGITSWFRQRKEKMNYGELIDERAVACLELQDLLSVARKLKFQVVLTVEVNNLQKTFRVAGDSRLPEMLYNYAAGQRLCFEAEAQEWANKHGKRAGRWSPKKEFQGEDGAT